MTQEGVPRGSPDPLGCTNDSAAEFALLTLGMAGLTHVGIPAFVVAHMPPPPPRMPLRMTFSAVLWTNQSATGSIHYEASIPVAADITRGSIAQLQPLLDGRSSKAVTSFADGGLWAVQPFFNWSVCYVYPVPSIGPPSTYMPENFEQAIEQMLALRLFSYNSTRFDRMGFIDGAPCEVWRWEQSSPLGDFELVEWCVRRPTGLLLSVNRSAWSLQGGRNISEAAQNVFFGAIPTPSAVNFTVPSTCVDLRANATAAAPNTPLNDPFRLARINAESNGSWVAGPNPLYSDGTTVADAARRLGTETVGVWRGAAGWRLPPAAHVAARATAPLPTAFDARVAWAHCPSIARVRSQGRCGSCWAMSAAEVLADRLCTGANGSGPLSNLTLSAEYLLDCDANDNGCGGGLLDDAWRFLLDEGLPAESCIPYQQEIGPTPIPCYAIRGKCIEGPDPFKAYKPTSAYAVSRPGSAIEMQQELLAHGPIQVAFQVFSDFHSYRSGVYSRTKSAIGPGGGHAVKIVGWGVDEVGTDYWIVANSWGATWGDGGFFKIRRGTNECGIEQTPAAGLTHGLAHFAAVTRGRQEGVASVTKQPVASPVVSIEN